MPCGKPKITGESNCLLRIGLMATLTTSLAEIVARDGAISDYELWRERKRIVHQIYLAERERRPIGIELIYRMRIIEMAQHRRGVLDRRDGA